MSEQMNIVLIYSPNWIEFVKIELFAIFKTNPSPIKVYLISDAAGEFDTSRITSHFGNGYSTEFINAEALFDKKIPSKVNVDSRFTKYALYRLLIPELIQEDKILYIDTDAIVNGNLAELYNIDLDNYYVAGAIDIGADQYNLKKPIGLGVKDNYINAGVLLMNLDKIRNSKINEQWIKEANHKLYSAHDQCIINKTCRGKIKLISNKYNCSISTGLNVPRESIVISHYAGNIKPWQSGSVPNARIWFDWVREYKKVFGESK